MVANNENNQIQNYITLRQAGNTVSRDLAQDTIDRSNMNTRNNLSPLEFYAQQPMRIPQEEKNAVWDFAGNLLWNAVDTFGFGIPGWLDYEDHVQDFLTGEEGPTTFAGRVGG